MQFYCLFGIRNDTKKEMNERKKIKKKSEIHQLRKRKRWVQCEQVKGMNRCHLFLFIFLLLMLLMRLTVCGKATNSLHFFFFTVPLHCHGPIVLSSVLVDICLSAIAQQPCWCVFTQPTFKQWIASSSYICVYMAEYGILCTDEPMWQMTSNTSKSESDTLSQMIVARHDIKQSHIFRLYRDAPHANPGAHTDTQ